MKYKITLFLLLILLLSFVSAESMSFKQGEDVNYRFRCFDENNNYCNSGVKCQISTELEETGQNLQDNESLTYNPTYFNISIPTDNLGIHNSIIMCQGNSNSSLSEFNYLVSPSGKSGTSNTSFFILIIVLIYALTFLSLFWARNIPMTVLSGMLMMFLGVYMIRYGIIIYRDNLTNYLSYVTIALGFIFSSWATLEQFDVI